MKIQKQVTPNRLALWSGGRILTRAKCGKGTLHMFLTMSVHVPSLEPQHGKHALLSPAPDLRNPLLSPMGEAEHKEAFPPSLCKLQGSPLSRPRPETYFHAIQCAESIHKATSPSVLNNRSGNLDLASNTPKQGHTLHCQRCEMVVLINDHT